MSRIGSSTIVTPHKPRVTIERGGSSRNERAEWMNGPKWSTPRLGAVVGDAERPAITATGTSSVIPAAPSPTSVVLPACAGEKGDDGRHRETVRVNRDGAVSTEVRRVRLVTDGDAPLAPLAPAASSSVPSVPTPVTEPAAPKRPAVRRPSVPRGAVRPLAPRPTQRMTMAGNVVTEETDNRDALVLAVLASLRVDVTKVKITPALRQRALDVMAAREQSAAYARS